MQSRLEKLAWSKVEASWYKVGDKVPNNWPGSALEYKRRYKTPFGTITRSADDDISLQII